MAAFVSTELLYQAFIKCNMQVTTDTRKPVKGGMFIALKGSNFNANEFAAKAIENGCLFAVVDDERYAGGENILLVQDTLAALQALANHHRLQFNIPFLAITGSNAKTTHKELINAVLSKKYNCIATEGNLNNHIGVPLTLLRVRKEHEFAIIEMGANHQGEIDLLCRIAEPNYGLITNIGKAHLEGFGGIEGVKKGKSELYRFLKGKGRIFINGDDPILCELGNENDKITYGTQKLYDTIGKNVSSGETVSFKFTGRYGEKDWNKLPSVNTSIIGSYNFINCLAASAIGMFFKVAEKDIREGLEEYLPNMNRSQLIKTQNNTIILDAYNANPNSMQAAIENFSAYPAEQKLLLLGDMFELGEYSKDEHARIVQLLHKNKFGRVILVGKEFASVESNGYLKFDTTEACLDHLKKNRVSGTTVLIKGSRGMKMETLQQAL